MFWNHPQGFYDSKNNFPFFLVKVLVKPEKKYWSADKVLQPISGPPFFSVILSYFSFLSSLIFQCDVRQSTYFSFTSVSSLKNYSNCFLCILIFIYNIIWHIYIFMYREYRKASQQKYFWTKCHPYYKKSIVIKRKKEKSYILWKSSSK